jgi:glycine/D-amino acid oxidase-like deaminating enzyme/nitrite reductase/ring-hydroxylating ferredoxin subunit
MEKILSYWIDTTEDTSYPKVENDIDVDVAIVGGGITGLTTAYLLNKRGVKLAVIDANRIAKGTSGHTTAKITSQHSLKYAKAIKSFGEEKSLQYAQANEAAIGLVEEIVKENEIDCDFKRVPAYVFTQDEEYVKKLEDETSAARSLKLPAEYTDVLDLPFTIKGAVRFSNQAQFHPRKYLLKLASIIEEKGSLIFENTRIVDIQEGDPHIVVTDSGKKIRAASVVQATRYPFFDTPGLYFSRLYPERSYLIGMHIDGSFPEGMFINAESPSRTLRLHTTTNDTILLVGGENHKTGHGEDLHKHYENVLDFAQRNFNIIDAPFKWSAQDYTAMDEIPIIGRMTSEKNSIYVATGYEKWGMSNGTAAAMIISDLILKGESPWEEVYNPSRFTPVASAKNFIIENADVAKNYIAGKLNIPDDEVDIGRGEAVITEVDGNKVGMYRDMDGNRHIVSTTCTHIGCELKWNSAELSWDCPCHGSRFTYTGDIIEGPALENIKPKESSV